MAKTITDEEAAFAALVLRTYASTIVHGTALPTIARGREYGLAYAELIGVAVHAEDIAHKLDP